MLWLIPALPLLGFLLLAALGRWLPRLVIASVGVGSVTAAFLVLLLILLITGADHSSLPTLWFSVGDLRVAPSLRLDGLSATFAAVVTGVGALIHLYAVDYMRDDPDLARFFAWMNLFVAAMLTLVLADDLLLLYLGWEGVGLCSYALIGFWYADPVNGRAARKAFIVTRTGDLALLIGLLTIATTLGTLQLPAVLTLAPTVWAPATATFVTALLLLGSTGKSAQLPLHVWLPDAMAGPTPVSALIHAATMVTAGVYLIARTLPLFQLAPSVLQAVAWLGVATMLFGAVVALGQTELKRLLAWSTMSQVGLMLVGLGAGDVSAATLHFASHAAFKALLFLGAGVLLHAVQTGDITRMGGLARRMPLTFGTFVIASAALAGLPFVTVGFISKELVLTAASEAPAGGALSAIALLGSLLTSLYIFRAVFLVFFGPMQRAPEWRPRLASRVPMLVLAALTLAGALLPLTSGVHVDGTTALLASAASLLGLLGAWGLTGWRAPGWLAAGFGVDALYERSLVRPYVALGRLNQSDSVDLLFRGIAWLSDMGHRALAATQTGRIRGYLEIVVLTAIGLLSLAHWRGP